MILSDVSVKRPVFATVIALLLVAFGIMPFFQLPLREYPDIDPPMGINTNYPGASAAVVENKITELIEDRLADVEERLKYLRHVRKVLKSALVQCQQQKNTDRCQVVDRLRRGKDGQVRHDP